MKAVHNQVRLCGVCSRRGFLRAGAGALGALGIRAAQAQEKPKPPQPVYVPEATGIRILPGQWRPHYPWEQIAWVSPPWGCEDYLWLDFPEAIFIGQDLVFLSHLRPELEIDRYPAIPWTQTPDGLSFERTLRNGVEFGGSLRKKGETEVDLELHIRNGASTKLTSITLQTCAYLRAIREFADFTRENKLVHVPEKGWIPMTQALELTGNGQPYRVGWRTKGKGVADVPMVITVSGQTGRLFAFTWGKDTLSMIGNPHHPCAHADPKFPNLEPGQEASVRGKLVFFDGNLEDFDYQRYL